MSPQDSPRPDQAAGGIDEAMLERAAELRRARERADRERQVEVLFLFDLAGLSLAVPAVQVGSVDEQRTPCILPGCPPHVLGVVSHAGRVVPVLDLARFLDLPVAATSMCQEPGGRMIVMTAGDLEVAVPCERARGLLEVGAETATEPNVLQGKLRRFLKAETRHGDRVVGILDLGALLEAARVA